MQPVLIIACGALARELQAVIRANGWEHVRVQCLPAHLHNRPERIPAAVRGVLEEADMARERVFVAYADCGTGGRLDLVLSEYGVERLPGAHCYQFFAGREAFDALADAEPGTLYLTDFLARHFDRLVIGELGIGAHPELLAMYFGNYRRLVYLAQGDDPALLARARAAASRLGLEFEHRFTGYGELAGSLQRFIDGGRPWLN